MSEQPTSPACAGAVGHPRTVPAWGAAGRSGHRRGPAAGSPRSCVSISSLWLSPPPKTQLPRSSKSSVLTLRLLAFPTPAALALAWYLPPARENLGDGRKAGLWAFPPTRKPGGGFVPATEGRGRDALGQGFSAPGPPPPSRERPVAGAGGRRAAPASSAQQPRRRTRDHLALARKKAVLEAVGFSPENVPKTPGLSRALWGTSRACAVATLPQRTPQASADGRDTVGAPSAGDSEGTLARVPPQCSAPASAPLPGGAVATIPLAAAQKPFRAWHVARDRELPFPCTWHRVNVSK